MAEFCELMKLLLSVPVVGAAPERAEVIARKLRMAEIEEDDIRYLDADDVKQITGVTAERVRLRRLIENVDVAPTRGISPLLIPCVAPMTKSAA